MSACRGNRSASPWRLSRGDDPLLRALVCGNRHVRLRSCGIGLWLRYIARPLCRPPGLGRSGRTTLARRLSRSARDRTAIGVSGQGAHLLSLAYDRRSMNVARGSRAGRIGQCRFILVIPSSTPLSLWERNRTTGRTFDARRNRRMNTAISRTAPHLPFEQSVLIHSLGGLPSDALSPGPLPSGSGGPTTHRIRFLALVC